MKPGAGEFLQNLGSFKKNATKLSGALSMVREEEDLSRVMSNYEQDLARHKLPVPPSPAVSPSPAPSPTMQPPLG